MVGRHEERLVLFLPVCVREEKVGLRGREKQIVFVFVSGKVQREFQLRCKNSGKVDIISSFFVSVGRV